VISVEPESAERVSYPSSCNSRSSISKMPRKSDPRCGPQTQQSLPILFLNLIESERLLERPFSCATDSTTLFRPTASRTNHLTLDTQYEMLCSALKCAKSETEIMRKPSITWYANARHAQSRARRLALPIVWTHGEPSSPSHSAAKPPGQ
jgi:hypothetical protein